MQEKAALIIAELKAKKISELPGDYYWNIFFKDYYLLKGRKLITRSEENRLLD